MPKLIIPLILGAVGLAAAGGTALPQDHRQPSSGRVTVEVSSIKAVRESTVPGSPSFLVKYSVTNATSEEIVFIDHLMHLNVEVKTPQGRAVEPAIQVRLAEPDSDCLKFVKPGKTRAENFTSLPYDVPKGMKSVTVSLVFIPPTDPKSVPKPKEPHGRYSVFPVKKLVVAPIVVNL